MERTDLRWHGVELSGKRISPEAGLELVKKRLSFEDGIELARKKPLLEDGLELARKRPLLEDGVELARKRQFPPPPKSWKTLQQRDTLLVILISTKAIFKPQSCPQN